MNAEVDALVAKWREEADALELIGYMWPANRLRQCADELAALAARPAAPVGEAERLLSRGQARAIHIMTNVAHARNGKVLFACDGPDCTVCTDLTLLKLPRALAALAPRAPEPVEPPPEHRCGVQGFDQMRGDVCPACDARRKAQE